MTVRDLLFQLLNVEDIDTDVVVRCYGDEGTSIQNIDDIICNSAYAEKVYLTINADKVLKDLSQDQQCLRCKHNNYVDDKLCCVCRHFYGSHYEEKEEC